MKKSDWATIRDSLKFTIQRFEDYDGYPSYEYKQKRIEEVSLVMRKVKDRLRRNPAR